MPNVTVKPIQTVNVRVNQQNQAVVTSSSTFVGSADAAAQIEIALAQSSEALNVAGQAIIIANSAYELANTANTSVTELSHLIDGGIFT